MIPTAWNTAKAGRGVHTTYLPARAISEAVGKPIQWDGSVQGVYIGKHSSDSPVEYLSQMDYFTKDGEFALDHVTQDNLGKEHTHSIKASNSASCSITYRLNGEYSRLTALFYQTYDARISRALGATLIITGDGRQLWQGSVAPGTDPINIDIDISGVLELTLEFPKNVNNLAYNAALGDVALWS